MSNTGAFARNPALQLAKEKAKSEFTTIKRVLNSPGRKDAKTTIQRDAQSGVFLMTKSKFGKK